MPAKKIGIGLALFYTCVLITATDLFFYHKNKVDKLEIHRMKEPYQAVEYFITLEITAGFSVCD